MKSYRYLPFFIFVMNLIFYALFNYGGIRSPDSEIVFRTTQSLVLKNEFEVQKPIDWTYWGLGLGKDNKHYSIFGPAESIFAIPLLKFAYYLEERNLTIDSNYIPISFHVLSNNEDAGLYFIEGKRPPLMKGQYIRFIVSFFNILIGALSGVFLYFLLLELTKSRIVSFYSTFLYSFGSLIFSYTGTFFSEPLCTLFMILSFWFIVKNETQYSSVKYSHRNYFYSGLFLGLAIATHISAVLSVPFYFMFILGQIYKEKLDLNRFWISSIYFTIGLAVFSGFLLYYNFMRFGNIFETGRFADHLYHYAIYTNPLPALYELLLGSGKGLLVYSPIVLLAFIFWKSFHKYFPHLSIAIIGMIFIRLFFIASRSDWHGGFCLGPRYFVIIIPFFFVPIAYGIKVILEKRKLKYFLMVGLFGFLCIIQQIFFSVGEIFSYLHIILRQQRMLGIETLVNNSLYTDWQYSPALYLLNYKTGPFFLKFLSLNNYLLWVWMGILFFIVFSIINYLTYETRFRNSNEPIPIDKKTVIV